MLEMKEFRKVAHHAVITAEKSILHYFHHLPPIEKKVDLTPVTKADREAEEIIVNIIHKAFPSHGFMGEEFGVENDKAEFVWIIDPIDGTKNFIHGLDFFGTVLGLKYQGEVILGLSNMPVLKELLYASTEEKTILNGKPAQVSRIANLEDAFVTLGGLTKLSENNYLRALIALEKKVLNVRGYGDVHGYHLVATGRADVMLEPAVKPWDVSAYEIIIKQAGGKYSDFAGVEHTLGPTSLATNGMLHSQLVTLLNSS